MSGSGKQTQGGAASYYRLVVVTIAAAGVALQAASMGPLRDSFWGFHLYAFLPFWVAALSWIAVALAAVVLLFGPGWKHAEQKGAPGAWIDRVPAWGTALFVVLCAVVFWLLRSDQTLLGDGLPLTIDLPKGQSFHPRQPLAMWMQQAAFRALYGVFSGDGAIPPEVARRTVAAANVLAGALFVLVAVFLGRGLARYRHHGSVYALPATVALVGQGYAVLFFGYVENYTVYALTIVLYLWTAVIYLQSRASLAFAALTLVAGLGVHLSSVSLLPSFLFLAVLGVANRERRKDAAAGLAALVAGLALLSWLLWWISPGYTLWTGVSQIADVSTSSQGRGAGLSYVFGWTHLRDFINEHYLAGPLAAFLFVPAVIYAARRREHTRPASVFFALAAGLYLAGSWVVAEPLLGYARDWDLFAPAAVTYCAAGLYFLIHHVRSPGRRNRLLLFAAAVSVVHLIPWVWINHSESLTLERFKTLPLGLGRTEVVVANYYMRKDRSADAEQWFKKAIEANPRNVNAYYLLGVLYANNGFSEPACRALEVAVSMRGDKVGYREQYVRALLDADRCADAVTHLMWLSRRKPGDAVYWQSIGDRLIGTECESSLREIYAPVLSEAQRRIHANPRDEDGRVYAALLLVKTGRLEEAHGLLAAVLEMNPDSAAALFNGGMVLVQMGRPDEARPLLQRFLSIHPNHPMAPAARQYLSPPNQ